MGRRKKLVDRLSELPDHILHHILSFIDTKSAVRTSVLSKKWRNTWTSLPDLYFDCNSFKSSTSFNNFVLAVLTHHNSQTISKFHFTSTSEGNDAHFKKVVINYAISHDVEHLVVELDSIFYYVTQTLLACQSLKTLKFSCFSFIGGFGCPKLTTLHLHRCWFLEGGDLCYDVLAGCPNLINLSLVHCHFGKPTVLKLSAPQLLNLTIDSLGFWEDYCKVEISAPELVFFTYRDSAALEFTSIHLPSLERVEIDVFLPSSIKRTQTGEQEACLNFFKLLRGLHRTQFLTLFASACEALDAVTDMLECQPSPFSRLKTVELLVNADRKSDKLMSYLLSGSPSVKPMVVEFPDEP